MANNVSTADETFMRRAIELARRGEGFVEPNPMVGCVIVAEGQIVGEGWHRKFGGPHAEVDALRTAGEAARGATAYVSLEPCCHHGKTPPCTHALIAAGIVRVVIGTRDPYEKVSGGGVAALREAGIATIEDVCEEEARSVLAPYLKLVTTGRPWVIAKWAMSLDGKIATHTGDSKWITSEASRQVVHALRGRVDGILIGRKTAAHDDPLLTARPTQRVPDPEAGTRRPVMPGAGSRRTAARIVLDSQATLSPTSQLVQTVEQAPVILAVSEAAPPAACRNLAERGVEIVCCAAATFPERLSFLLAELGRRRMTNLLVEGGGEVLGTFLDMRQIDEVHAFIAPKLIGGRDAVTPMSVGGVERIADALELGDLTVSTTGGDVYITGRSYNYRRMTPMQTESVVTQNCPRQFSLVRFAYEQAGSDYHCGYPFTKDGVYVFFGDIPNMPGHCVVADHRTGQIYSGYHTENFVEIIDDEVIEIVDEESDDDS